MEILGFSRYELVEGSVLDKVSKKVMCKHTRPDRTSHGYFKLKDDAGKWRQLSERKLLALVAPVEPPEGFVKIPTYENTYLSKEGKVWRGPTLPMPLGMFLKVSYREDRYPTIEAEGRIKEIHQLLVMTFMDEFYVEKGLCAMHLDDNKHNFSLPNLKIGTYSENNKAAYDTGVNPGNGLKKR